MSKCCYCNRELITGDNSSKLGLCSKCYDDLFRSNECALCSNKDKIIKYLEAKLADKDEELLDKNREISNLKQCEFIAKTLDFNKLSADNYRLREQLAEKESEHELLINQFEEETEKLRKQIKQESDARKRFVEEVKNLKQQLAEKEKKIVELEEHDEIYHNQLAIEQLELIKEKAMEEQSNGWKIKYKDRYDILMDIENQIKQLKGGK